MPPRPGATKTSNRYDDDEDEGYEPPPRRARRDDDDDDRPPRRAAARPADDDDDDDRPRRPRPAARDDDDDRDDDRPRRAARPRDDYDDDDRPRARRPRADEYEEEDRHPRRSVVARDDDEDDDRAPAPRRRPATRDDDDDDRPAPRRARSRDDDDDDGEETYATGWDGASRIQSKTGSYTENLKVGEDPVLVKFLADAPVVSYGQHWVQRKGRMSFVCAGAAKCPLCALGDDPRAQFVFAVAEIDGKGKGALKLFAVSGKVKDQIKKLNDDPRNGPLTKGYWAVSKSGKRQTSVTNLLPVKSRDLEEDYGFPPLSNRAVDSLVAQVPDPGEIGKASIKALKEVAAELVGDTEDDD